jgi:hypothetical protein
VLRRQHRAGAHDGTLDLAADRADDLEGCRRRKVISRTGRPPATNARASGRAVPTLSIASTGTTGVVASRS